MTSNITTAVLFYSKYNQKSVSMRNTIKNYTIDIDCINVDNKKTRLSIIQNKKYLIKEIPSILLIFDTHFKIYTREKMDMWFNDIVQILDIKPPVNNIQNTNLTELNLSSDVTTSLHLDKHTPDDTQPQKPKLSTTEIMEKMANERRQIELEEEEMLKNRL